MKKLLIVVDYQKDFVDGALGFEKAVSIEGKIAEKIKKYKQNKDEIIFTFDTHEKNYLHTQEGKLLPVEHCIRGTEGWELYGSIKDLCDDTTKKIEKVTFGSLELAEYVKDKKYDQIELVGVVSNICVISNAVLVKAALPEAEIIVDAQCTASNDDSLNDKVLDVMGSLQIKVINR